MTGKLLNKLKSNEMASIVAKGSLGIMIIHASGIAITAGLHILLARLMGVAEYGVYSYSISWVLVFVLLAKLGFDSVNLRFVATYKAAHDLGRLKGVISRNHMFVLGTSLILVVISSFAILILKDHINKSLFFTLWAGIFAAMVISQLQLVATSLRGLHRAVLSYLPDPILRPLILAVLAGIIFLYKNELMAFEAMLLNCISLISALILGKVILKRSLPHDLWSALPKYETREWLRTALPLFFISGMYLLLNQTDMLMVGAILGTDEAGVYAAVTKISTLSLFALTATNTLSAPMIAKLYSEGQKEELQHFLKLICRIVFIITFPIALLLIFGGQWVLFFFGAEFVPGSTALSILVIGQLINAFVGPVGYLFTMTAQQNIAAKVIGGSACFNVILNAALIPTMGIEGAAFATALSVAMLALTLFYLANRLMGLRVSPI